MPIAPHMYAVRKHHVWIGVLLAIDNPNEIGRESSEWPKVLGLRTEGGFTSSIATGRNCSA